MLTRMRKAVRNEKAREIHNIVLCRSKFIQKTTTQKRRTKSSAVFKIKCI